MRVKTPHQSIPSSTRRPGQTKNKKQNKIPTSSSGGAWHRKHPFKRYTMGEEDDQI